MILRNAILSDQPRLVGLGRNVPAAARAFDKPENAEVERASAVAVGAEMNAVGMSILEGVLPQAPAPKETRLSFEAVAAWLAIQDGETRSACASVLAEELTQAHEAAKIDGYAAGIAQAREESQVERRNFCGLFDSIVNDAEEAFAKEKAKLADVCVDIVAEAFAKIAGQLLPTREACIGAVTEVLKRVKEGRELMIRVHPADLPVLQSEERPLAAVLPGRKFSVVPDSCIDLGGCIVESKLGSLDGRLEVQLRELYATLRVAKLIPAGIAQ